MLLAICFLLLGIVLLCVAGLLFYAAVVFHKFPERTERAAGLLRGTKHKRNVTVRGGRHTSAMFLKHLTAVTYVYTVNGKSYALHDHKVGTPKEAERAVAVRYLKRFPRIAYLEDGIESFGIYGFLFLVGAVTAFIAAGLLFSVL